VNESFQIADDGRIPVESNIADVAMLDWVCEHLADPEKTFKEIFRVVKPGGWIALRTPNRWHYSMIASRMVPDSLHARVLSRVQEGRQEHDVFPKHYRANTPRTLRRLLRAAGFESPIVMSHEPEPVYLQFNAATFTLGAVYQRLAALMPTHAGRLVLMAFARKPGRALVSP
jgi:ubiquinone/menaquinone biosynthesis C-methylase UbiE